MTITMAGFKIQSHQLPAFKCASSPILIMNIQWRFWSTLVHKRVSIAQFLFAGVTHFFLRFFTT